MGAGCPVPALEGKWIFNSLWPLPSPLAPLGLLPGPWRQFHLQALVEKQLERLPSYGSCSILDSVMPRRHACALCGDTAVESRFLFFQSIFLSFPLSLIIRPRISQCKTHDLIKYRQAFGIRKCIHSTITYWMFAVCLGTWGGPGGTAVHQANPTFVLTRLTF